MDPRIQIRFHTKISWIRNTGENLMYTKIKLKADLPDVAIFICISSDVLLFVRSMGQVPTKNLCLKKIYTNPHLFKSLFCIRNLDSP
jgi:hypothetical protein